MASCFVGWGIELTEYGHTLFCFDDGQPWLAGSAESLLRSLNVIAHVRLRWRDGRADDGTVAA